MKPNCNRIRVWETKTRKWISPAKHMGFDETGLIIPICLLEIHKKVIINRSTGYCDSEGKEVFEGDIVETNISDSNSSNGCWKAIVKWNNSTTQWCLGTLDQCDKFGELERYVDTTEYRALYSCKVIGNIYNNYRLAKRL